MLHKCYILVSPDRNLGVNQRFLQFITYQLSYFPIWKLLCYPWEKFQCSLYHNRLLCLRKVCSIIWRIQQNLAASPQLRLGPQLLMQRTCVRVSPDFVHLFLLRSLAHSRDEPYVGSLLWFLLKLWHFILYQESHISLVEVFVLIGIILVKFCAPDLTLSCLILSRTLLKREQSIERMPINANGLTKSIPRAEKLKVSSACCPSLDKEPRATVWKL